MTLRTLLVGGIAASLLAACSGGAGSSGANGTLTVPTQSAVRVEIDASQLQANGRAAKFVGASVDTVAYSFSPGPITGTLALSSCPATGTPAVYTCTIGLPDNTYSLSLTLKKGSTAVGTATYPSIVVTGSQTTTILATVSPVNSGPTLAINNGQATQFYADGTTQTIATTLNELDPVGNIISTFYGPVLNYPTLTITPGGGTAGVTVNGGALSVATAPTTQAGGSANLVYNGTSLNSSSFTIKASDGATSTQTITVPFVKLTASTPSVQMSGIGGTTNVTFTEAATTGGTLDTTVSSSSTCANAASFSPGLVTLGSGNALTANAITFTITALSSSPAVCTLTVASFIHPTLTSSVTINLPAAAGVTIQ